MHVNSQSTWIQAAVHPVDGHNWRFDPNQRSVPDRSKNEPDLDSPSGILDRWGMTNDEIRMTNQ